MSERETEKGVERENNEDEEKKKKKIGERITKQTKFIYTNKSTYRVLCFAKLK